MKKILPLLIMAALGTACTVVGPNYEQPQTTAPDSWRSATDGSAELVNALWWKKLNDPVLDRLIVLALENNQDIRVAAARVGEFAGRVDIARSGLYPQIGYGLSGSRDQLSRNTRNGIPNGVSRVDDTFQGGLNVGWELDFWGKVARLSEAARADLLSSEESRRAIILSLVSNVASSYVQLLSLDKQLMISKETVQRRAESVALFKVKFHGGVVSELEVAQVQSEYEFAKIRVPAIELQIALLENAMSVLLGRHPGDIARGKQIDDLVLPGVPADIPSEVLLRRPDIRSAENELIAANARIGVAQAAFFPSISLTGLLGFASADLGQFLNSSSGVWSAAGALAGPIFTGGNLEAQLLQTEETQKRLLAEYQQSIYIALREVDDALVSVEKLKQQVEAQQRQVAALKSYAHFARIRYEDGYVSYIEVVDSERSLFDAELELAKKDSDVFVAMISIYKAMGGGWLDQAVAVANTVDYPIVKAEKEE